MDLKDYLQITNTLEKEQWQRMMARLEWQYKI